MKTNSTNATRRAWSRPSVSRIEAGSAEGKKGNGVPDGASGTGNIYS